MIYRLFLIVMVLFLFRVPFSIGQTNLIQAFSTNFSTLSLSETQDLQRLQSSDLFETIYIVDFNEMSSCLQNGRVQIQIPGEPCGETTFLTKSIEYQSSSDYSWHGSIENSGTCSFSIGDAMVYRKDGVTVGYFYIDENYYTFKSISTSSDKVFLGKLNHPTGSCEGTPDSTLVTPPPVTPAPPPPGEPCVVRVLVVFTEAAANLTGLGWPQMAAMQIYRANQVLKNSGISPDVFRWEFAGAVSAPPNIVNENGLSLGKVVHDLELSLPPWVNSSPFSILVEPYHADVFVLFVDFHLTVQSNSTATTNTRFAGLSHRHLLDPYTVEHEMGHIAGAGHERCGVANAGLECIGNSNNPPFPARAHIFLHGATKMRTIVFNNLGAPGLILSSYSTPTVSVGSHPLGYTGLIDNASVIKSNACKLAALNPGFIGDPPINISGGSSGLCREISETFTVENRTPTNQYSFAWRASSDGSSGTSFGLVLSTSSVLNYFVPASFVDPYVVLQVEVTNISTGAKSVEKITVSVKTEGLSSCPQLRGGDSVSKKYFNVSLSQNPILIGDEIRLKVISPETHLIEIILTTNLGIEIGRAEELLTQESNESDFRIHTQNLSGGIYFLVIFRDGKRMDTKKVILH